MTKKLEDLDKIIKSLEDEVVDDIMYNIDKIKEVILFVDENCKNLENIKCKSIEDVYKLSD